MKKKTQKDVPSAKSVAALSGREAVACQFQDRDGKWCNFNNDEHRDNTIADGSWPIRWLYTTPQPGGGWRDVSDELPIESGWYIGVERSGTVGPLRWDGSYWHHTRPTRDLACPSHWMPLPAALSALGVLEDI